LASGSLIFSQDNGQGIWLLSRDLLRPQVLFAEGRVIWVSPYTGTIAWFEVDAIRFRKPTGEEFQIPRRDSWFAIRQWFPDDKILIRPKSDYDPTFYMPPIKALDNFDVLSPQTGEVTSYSLTFPGFFSVERGQWRSIPLYNSTLNRVIYERVYSGSDPYESEIVLWDVAEQVELWKKGEKGWPALTGNLVVAKRS
jgi:hypothetical protein